LIYTEFNIFHQKQKGSGDNLVVDKVFG